MRHLKAGRQFSRDTAHRKAMLRNLTANLITHERIQTTDAKAKELRRVAERLISKAVRLGEVAYTKPPAEAPADPAEVKALERRRARRLHVQRMISAELPRFGAKAENGTTKRVDIVEKVLSDLAKRFQGRAGGYTRIVKLGPRRGDNAAMSLVELVGTLEESKATKEAWRTARKARLEAEAQAEKQRADKRAERRQRAAASKVAAATP
jgi:large subunit ribosomal protein L17